VRQRAGVFESNLIYFFNASTFERPWLEQARGVAFTGKLFTGCNRPQIHPEQTNKGAAENNKR
jgi:hypothetical protein